MYKSIFSLFAIFSLSVAIAQNTELREPLEDDASFADYQAFVDLVNEVQSHRAERMISLEEMNKMSLEENTIILDTRSKAMYDAKHVKGAVHLTFADFTRNTLAELIATPDTRIIIYCNNNFLNDQINFATKSSGPVDEQLSVGDMRQNLGITMALNIPTYINLYGYGYKNVYELKDLISVYSTEIEFEGTDVASN